MIIRSIGVALVALFALFAPLLFVPTPLAGDEDPDSSADMSPIQVRLVWTENPQKAAVISWTTRGEGRTHLVYYDKTSHADEPDARYRYKTPAAQNGRYSGRRPTGYYHHAELTGLKAGTRYFVRLESDDQRSREYWFETAPSKRGSEFRLLSGGDSRSDREQRRVMNKRVAALVAENEDIIAFAHGGDYVSDGEDLEQWDEWLDDFNHTIPENGRLLPLIPARGNHEADGPLFDEVFGSPGGAMKNRYVTHVSPEVSLVTLNTEISMGGDQRAFLESALQQTRRVRWVLAQYHRPAWPAVKEPSSAKVEWVPLFEQYNVDLVLESDGHVLKRTVPIRNGKHDPTGVTYVGEGGMGVSQRDPESDRWFLQQPGMTKSAHHIWIVGFGDNEITLRALSATGETLDEHVIADKR